MMTTKEAEDFLNTIDTTKNLSNTTVSDIDTVVQDNTLLIKECNDLIYDRVRNRDSSLRLSDVITAKDTAFKQNQLILGKATENINLNVKELDSKTSDELLELLEILS